MPSSPMPASPIVVPTTARPDAIASRALSRDPEPMRNGTTTTSWSARQAGALGTAPITSTACAPASACTTGPGRWPATVETGLGVGPQDPRPHLGDEPADAIDVGVVVEGGEEEDPAGVRRRGRREAVEVDAVGHHQRWPDGAAHGLHDGRRVVVGARDHEVDLGPRPVQGGGGRGRGPPPDPRRPARRGDLGRLERSDPLHVEDVQDPCGRAAQGEQREQLLVVDDHHVVAAGAGRQLGREGGPGGCGRDRVERTAAHPDLPQGPPPSRGHRRRHADLDHLRDRGPDRGIDDGPAHEEVDVEGGCELGEEVGLADGAAAAVAVGHLPVTQRMRGRVTARTTRRPATPATAPPGRRRRPRPGVAPRLGRPRGGRCRPRRRRAGAAPAAAGGPVGAHV